MIFGKKNSGRSGEKAEENSQKDEMRKLTREELLEMLIDETRIAEDLQEKNRLLTEELTRVKSDLDKVASLEVIIKRLGAMVGYEEPEAEPEAEQVPYEEPEAGPEAGF